MGLQGQEQHWDTLQRGHSPSGAGGVLVAAKL